MNLKRWRNIEWILKEYEVLFICASDKQKALLGKMIEMPKNYLTQLPFPVNEDVYYFDPGSKEKTKKILDIKKDEITYFYAGR